MLKKQFAYWGTALIWGASFVANQVIAQAMSATLGAALRIGIASVGLVLTVGFTAPKALRISKSSLIRCFVVGFYCVGATTPLLYLGQRLISPGTAGIIDGTVPFWTVVFSFFLGRERVTLRQWGGVGIGMGGLLMLYGPRVLQVSNFGTSKLFGELCITIMAVSYGLGTVLNRLLLSDKDEVRVITTTVYQHLWAFGVLILASCSNGGQRRNGFLFITDPRIIAALLYVGLMSSALGFYLYYYLIRQAGPVFASSLAYVVPIVAVCCDYVVNHRAPKLFELIAALIIIVALVLLFKDGRQDADRD